MNFCPFCYAFPYRDIRDFREHIKWNHPDLIKKRRFNYIPSPEGLPFLEAGASDMDDLETLGFHDVSDLLKT